MYINGHSSVVASPTLKNVTIATPAFLLLTKRMFQVGVNSLSIKNVKENHFLFKTVL